MKKSIISIIILIILIIVGCAVGIWYLRAPSEQVKIGAILSLTGPAAPYGTWAKNGIELALAEENKNVPMVIFEDDQSSAEKAVSAIQKMIQVDKVKVIIMSTPSSSFLAAAPIAEKSKVVLFTPGSSAPGITNAGDYIFRNRVNGLDESNMAADVVSQMDKNRVAVLAENTDFGKGYGDVFKNNLKMGKELISDEYYAPKSMDYRSAITKFKSQGIQVVYLVCTIDDCITILKQAEEIRFRPIWVSTSGIENKKILQAFTEDVLGRVYYVSENYDLRDPATLAFNNKYEGKYKDVSNLYASNSYDATKILLAAVKEVGYDSVKIKNYIYSIKGYNGINGKLSFDSNGDVVKLLVVKTIKDGQFVALSK